MSTLSPDDEEYERQKSRSLVQINSQHTNVDIERTDGDVHELPQEDDTNESGSSKANESCSRSFRKRNLSITNGTDFELGISRHVALDVLRKKRKTSNDRRDTHLPSPNDTNSSSQRYLLPPPVNIDLESENIDVVFQDSIQNDSFEHNNNPEDSELQVLNENRVNGRDHRPKVRQVFSRCFTGNTESMSYGEILAEASDEEI